jgi:hypothetical protein
MLKTLNRLAWILVAAVLLGGISYWMHRYTENERRIRQLEVEKRQLQAMVQRLTSQRRVAEMIVTGRRVEEGVPKLQLLFVEYARDEQTPVSVRDLTLSGTEVHIDAKVIRFDRNFVFEGDPLRGVSVALFTRAYGDKQTPEKGVVLDPAGVAPEVYKGADPAAADFEARLWKDFWRLLEDEPYAKAHGVRVAQGEGVWWPPQEGRLYTLCVGADGGIALKSEPVKAIYLEAMKKLTMKAPAPGTTGPGESN